MIEAGLAGLCVLVTGASGGIGDAVAEAFAGEGCSLVLHAGSHLAELERRVAGRPWADRALCGAADVRDEQALENLIVAAQARFGRVDIAVVNAGIWPAEERRLHELSPARVREVIEVDLLGAMWTCAAFMRGLSRVGPRPDGRGAAVCLVGSTAGRFGERGHADYAVAKAGLYGLLRTLKNELPELDPYARANLVEPGWTATPMAGPALAEPGVIPRVVKTMALRQIARPEDIARAILFLCSPALARHVSGEVLTVAGGMEGRTLWTEHDIDVAAIRRRLSEDER